MGYGQSYYTLRSIFMDGVPPPSIHVHIRMFHVATEIPIGELSTKETLDSTTAPKKPTAEVDVPNEEKETFDLWLRELWQDKDLLMTKFFETAAFNSGTALAAVEIPLRLRRKREFLDAFCFFLPASVGYLWGKLGR